MFLLEQSVGKKQNHKTKVRVGNPNVGRLS